jgi:hypothetical protein
MRNLLINGIVLLDLLALVGLRYAPLSQSVPVALLAVGCTIAAILIEWEQS